MRDPVADTAIAEQDAAKAATRNAVSEMRDRVATIAVRWISPDDHAAFYQELETMFTAATLGEDASYDLNDQYEY